MKKLKTILIIIFGLIISFIISCESNTNSKKELNLIGFVQSLSACKGLNKTTGLTKVVETLPDTLAGVEYHYDGNSKLILTHINAGFNCCPGTLSTVITWEDNDIFIEEFEEKADCRCNCLYDLTIVINDITPGNYAFTFIEPYRHDSDDIITFILGLNNEDSGLITVDRNGYPWGTKTDE